MNSKWISFGILCLVLVSQYKNISTFIAIEFALKGFKELDVNLDFLQLDNSSSTRVVNVDRDEFGDRFFSGFEESSHSYFADEVLSKKLIEKEILNLEKSFLETKYLVTGTILLTSPISSETIFFFFANFSFANFFFF